MNSTPGHDSIIYASSELVIRFLRFLNNIWDRGPPQSWQTRFMQRTVGNTKLDHKINQDILDILIIKPMIDYIQIYKRKWKEYANRMNTGRVPK
jgi:hypothetical protein